MRGSRRHCHVIHMAAMTQIAHKRSAGHAYYQRKLDEGKTPAEARRALKPKISNAIHARLQADARARQASAAQQLKASPGGQPGNDTKSSATGSHPERQLFGPATPRPATTPTPPRTAQEEENFPDIITSHLTNWQTNGTGYGSLIGHQRRSRVRFRTVNLRGPLIGPAPRSSGTDLRDVWVRIQDQPISYFEPEHRNHKLRY